MTDFDTAGLVERAKAITLHPDETWPKIAAEPTTPGDVITRYALPLLAIGPIAGFIGGQLFGVNMVFATYKPGLMTGITGAITGFVLGLVSVIVVALIADFLASKFNGQENRAQAFKLVAYAMTPGWLAGILGLVPALAALAILASLYGIYLFYKGATPLMKVPEDKAVGYTAVTVVSAIVVSWIAAILHASITGLFGLGAAGLVAASGSGDTAEINLPGGVKIDTGKMEEAAKQLEGMANGEAPKPVDMAALQALLPASVGAYQRTSVESAGVGGIGSKAEATYKNGDKQVRVEIVDIAGLGAVAGALGGIGIEQNREDADGYERTRTVDGVIQTEKWNNKRSSGSFGTQVAGRFMVEASGDAGSIDDLKAIVAGVDQGKLAGLAK